MIENSTSKSKSQFPNVYDYDDALKYIQDFYNYRKRMDPDFSYGVWAGEAGFKSRSYIRLVSLGERTISDQFVEHFSMACEFNLEQKKHFFLISQYSNAKNNVVKKIFKDSVHQNLEACEVVISPEDYAAILKKPLNLTVHVMVGFKDVEMTLEKLSVLLNLDSETVLESLTALQECQLIECYVTSQNQKAWRSYLKPFKFKDQPQSKHLEQYHYQNLKEAQQKSLESNENQRFRAITMSVDPNQFEEITNDIEDFLRKLKSKYNSDKIVNHQLFKFNLQTYPLTKKVN